MTATPLISIVVPSLNQGAFLGETLQSLVDQDYPNLEVIIQDGGSKDDSIAIAQEFARRFPDIFRVYVESDRGQAHALNLGFAKTRGESLGFLNSDDTLYPGCLQRVAREIDPTRGRWIVFGRCLFTGEGAPYVGVEHPAEFVSHFEQLAIWKRGYNTLPQPSVFWHRQVWNACGGFDEKEKHVLDYDLFCRFSAKYEFHKVDALWSTYRLHADSKSANKSEAEVLALGVAVSRRHWGGWWSPLRWRCECSYWLHNQHLHERARHHARRAEQAFADQRPVLAAVEFARTLACSPSMAAHRLLQPLLAGRGLHWLEKLVWMPGTPAEAVVEEFVGRYPDCWMGPRFRQPMEVPAGAGHLRYLLQHHPQPDGRHREIRVELWIDGQLRERVNIDREGPFEVTTDLTPFRGRTCWLELRAQPYFVPSALHEGSGDHRKLTALLLDSIIEPAG